MARRPGLARKLAAICAGLIVVWLIVALVVGIAIREHTAQRVADRIGASLQATGTVGDSDLGLVRGYLELEQLEVRRDDLVGKLDLTVAMIECDLLPLGLAMIDRDCGELAIRGMRLEVSSLALFKLKRPKRKPFHVGAITIDDATLVLSPTALAPSAGKVEIQIHHASAGATTFKTPLSFLFALETLRATLRLPAGIVVEIGFDHGMLTVAGGLFGATPVALPVQLPVADLADDPAAELKKLVEFAKAAVTKAIEQRASEVLGI